MAAEAVSTMPRQCSEGATSAPAALPVTATALLAAAPPSPRSLTATHAAGGAGGEARGGRRSH
jgi:hypothetical protein